MRLRIAVLLAGLLALVACNFDSGPRDLSSLPGGGGGTNAARAPTPGPPGGPVLAVGDSLLVGASEHGSLAPSLEEDGWIPETIAERGRSIPWAIDQIELRPRVPRYVVVVLGSNPGFSSAGFGDDVRALREALVQRGARRILWVPPHHTDPARYAEKLIILHEIDRTDRLLVVPDWGRVVDANPQWVTGDGIHMTDVGYIALAAFIRAQVARLG